MEDEEEDETDGSDEDVWGVAVSITSPEEVEDSEGNKNNMSPCLQNTREKNKMIKAVEVDKEDSISGNQHSPERQAWNSDSN